MMSVELLLEGVATTAGEGPHWDDKTQSLLFVDLRAATVYRWDSISGKLESRKLGIKINSFSCMALTCHVATG